MPLTPGVRFGPYEILDALGAGGMGEVYRARDTRLGREVAVKVLPVDMAGDESRLRRFEVEARAVGSLNHPNLLVLFDVGSQDGAPYVVTELLDGESLRDRLQGGALPARRAIDIAAQAARGLGAAHEKGIVHRDLKPENLFLTTDGRLKVLDFGLAKLTRPDPDGSSPGVSQTLPALSEVGQVLGTVGYMAPEQVQGKTVGPAADLFALGAVLYEMLSGHRAFQGDTAVDTLHAILRQEPPDLPSGIDVPPALDRIVRRCLEKRPEERFRSAHDLAFALETLSGSGSGALLPPVETSPPRRRWLRPVALVALLLGTVTATVAVMQWLTEAELQPPRITQVTLRRQGLWQARFGPDGQTVVYGASYQEKGLELFSARIGSAEARALGVQGADVFAVSSTGELAVRLGATGAGSGTLARMPLEGGSPREVLANVNGADWSPDGKDLAVVHIVNGRRRLEFPIGTVLAEADGFIGPKFSPKGDRLALQWVEGPNLFMAVADPSRPGPPHKVAEFPIAMVGHCWAPDGQAIRHIREGGRVSELRDLALDGRDRWLMTLPGNYVLQDCRADGAVLVERATETNEIAGVFPDEAQERDLSWLDLSVVADLSRDGRTLLFVERGFGDSPFSTYIRQTDGSPAVRLGDGRALALSPDGQWALVRGGGTEHALLPTRAGQARRLPLGDLRPRPPTGASWFPDGKRFIFTASAPGAGPRCYIQHVDGGDPQPVTPEGVEGCGFPSPDGRFVFAGRNTLFDLEQGTGRAVAGLTEQDEPVGWNEDGTAVFVVVRPSNASARIHRVEASSGRRTLLRELHTAGPMGAAGGLKAIRVSADGRTIVYTVNRYFSDLLLIEGLR